MLFNSIQFLIFFPIVCLVFWLIPQKLKKYWLLVASYYFYMCWNAKYIILILTSTIITYLSGIALDKINHTTKSVKMKKTVVAISVVLNLSILFFFKYFNFAMLSMSRFFALFHVQLNMPAFDVMLPVGISFYTFQALSYTIDVYRDDIYAEKNFFKYALFVSFFPQLVAGPIERSKNLLRQLEKFKSYDFERCKEGVLLMFWGFFLKIVLADRIAIFVDTIYGDYSAYEGFYLIVATILFAVQIYCDFAGYSTIAMGAAKIMGIELMENFDAPYLATSVADFWRRWHISLTSWFKDYLYIPLGGSRKGKLRKQINKCIVFLVSGLWHGASWSFVVWGGLNGLYQVIGETLMPIRNKLRKLFSITKDTLSYNLVHILGTFALVDFSWIFFRASGIREAFSIIKSMLTVHNVWILFDNSIYSCGLDIKNFNLMMNCILILIFADFMKSKKIKIREVIQKQDSWFQVIFLSLSITLILLFGIWGPGYNAANFIYFQF